jgi:hypothetical protein
VTIARIDLIGNTGLAAYAATGAMPFCVSREHAS